MIHFCYLKSKRLDDFNNELTCSLSKLNLLCSVIISSELQYNLILYTTIKFVKVKPSISKKIDFLVSQKKLLSDENVSLETLKNQNIKNIIVLDFESIKPKFMSSLINIRGKNTEIICVSREKHPLLKDIQIIISDCKNQEMNDEKIAVIMTLKGLVDYETARSLLCSYRYKNNNIRIPEIKTLMDIEQFLKHQ